MTGKDFFAPSTILMISWIFSTLCAIYKLDVWKFEIGNLYMFLTISSLSITVVINALVHNYFQKKPAIKVEENDTPINNLFVLLVLFFSLLVCFILYKYINKIGKGSDFGELMTNYRMKTAYGTNTEEQLPGFVRQLLNVLKSVEFILSFNLIFFWDKLKKKYIIINIVVLLICVFANLLTGGRFSTLSLIIGSFYYFHMATVKKNGKYAQFTLSQILKTLIVILAVLYGFFFVKGLVGRVSDDSAIDYIAHYVGGSVPGFNLFLNSPTPSSQIVGKETFYSLVQNLRKLKIIDVPYYYIHHEFRAINGVGIGNIYTALRDYYYDFGIFGMYMFHILFSVVYSIFYEKIKVEPKTIHILLFSLMYYCVLMYPISNYFYSNVISIGFFINVIWVYIMYLFLIKKKIRLVFKK